MDNNTIPVVVWSGGFDSTYLILKLIEDEIITNNVILFSIEHTLIGATKNMRERTSRQKILEWLKEKYPDINFITIVSTLGIEVNPRVQFHNSGLAQPIFWLSHLIPILKDGSTIYFGYLTTDDGCGYLHITQDFIDAGCRFQANKHLNIKFPLISYHKYDVLIECLSKYPELFEFCTTCENIMDNDFCGKCNPCIEMMINLSNIMCRTNKKTIYDSAKNELSKYKTSYRLTEYKEDK